MPRRLPGLSLSLDGEYIEELADAEKNGDNAEDDSSYCAASEGLAFFGDDGEADRPDAADDSDREGEAAER